MKPNKNLLVEGKDEEKGIGRKAGGKVRNACASSGRLGQVVLF